MEVVLVSRGMIERFLRFFLTLCKILYRVEMSGEASSEC